MKRRCRITVLPATWAYLLILVVVVIGAFIREINLLIILSGLMVGPLLINWRMVRATLRNIEVRRQLPRGGFPGEMVTVELTIENRRQRLDSWALLCEDRIRNTTSPSMTSHPDSIALSAPDPLSNSNQARDWPPPDITGRARLKTQSVCCLLPYVAAGQTARVSYQLRLGRRGRYRLGPLRISTKVPVGLLQGQVTFKEPADLLVYPRLGQLTSFWTARVQTERSGQRSSQPRQGQSSGDFYGLRDWRAGDCRRWIHWRSSAKRQHLVVRQFEQQRGRDLFLVLDLGHVKAPSDTRGSDDGRDAVELAIGFAATLIADYCRHASGRLILAVAGQRIQQLRAIAGPALLDEALELLADVTPGPIDRLPELLSVVLPEVMLGDPLLIVTPTIHLADPVRFAFSGEEGASLRNKLQKAMVVDVSDPQFPGWITWPARSHASFAQSSSAISTPRLAENPVPTGSAR